MRSRILISLFLLTLLAWQPGTALRDPTEPADMYNQTNPWQLTAIKIGHDKRMAIFADQIASVGTDIQGAKVIAIEPNYVELQNSDGRFKVFLLDQTIRHK